MAMSQINFLKNLNPWFTRARRV